MQTEIEILGYKVSTQGVSPLDSKNEAIKNWEALSTVLGNMVPSKFLNQISFSIIN